TANTNSQYSSNTIQQYQANTIITPKHHVTAYSHHHSQYQANTIHSQTPFTGAARRLHDTRLQGAGLSTARASCWERRRRRSRVSMRVESRASNNQCVAPAGPRLPDFGWTRCSSLIRVQRDALSQRGCNSRPPQPARLRLSRATVLADGDVTRRLRIEQFHKDCRRFKERFGRDTLTFEQQRNGSVRLRNLLIHQAAQRAAKSGQKTYTLGVTAGRISYISPAVGRPLPGTRLTGAKRRRDAGVKNQGQCGSLLVLLHTPAPLEGQHFRKTGRLLSLVRAAAACRLRRRSLWQPRLQWRPHGQCVHVHQRPTASRACESDYPYQAAESRCQYQRSPGWPANCTASWTSRRAPRGGDKLKRLLAQRRPGLRLPCDASHPSFQHYRERVYNEPSLQQVNSSWTNGDRSFVASGTTERQATTGLVKNSWSEYKIECFFLRTLAVVIHAEELFNRPAAPFLTTAVKEEQLSDRLSSRDDNRFALDDYTMTQVANRPGYGQRILSAGCHIHRPNTRCELTYFVYITRALSGLHNDRAYSTPRAIGSSGQLSITIGIFVGGLVGLEQALNREKYWVVAIALSGLPSLVSSIALPLLPRESPGFSTSTKVTRLRQAGCAAILRSRRSRRSYAGVEVGESQDGTTGGGGEVLYWDSVYQQAVPHGLLITLVLVVVQQLSGINVVKVRPPAPALLLSLAIVLVSLVALLIVSQFTPKSFSTATATQKTLSGVALRSRLHLRCRVRHRSRLHHRHVHQRDFPQKARGAANSVAMGVLQTSNALVVLTYYTLEKSLGHFVYLIYIVPVTAGLVFLFFFMPETKNRSTMTSQMSCRRWAGRGRGQRRPAEGSLTPQYCLLATRKRRSDPHLMEVRQQKEDKNRAMS
uniref:Pept_C1 domain-containing protein n=1 Tax=Macrostomum lignano TaxID=282301 RepID=A0A1I8JRT6_9PLAT